jgi:hypothetical protein
MTSWPCCWLRLPAWPPVLVYRGASQLLRTGERIARRGPVTTRLAFVGLARSPSGPSLAIAFIAVSTGLGAFALAYRATLLRSTADQAGAQVPLDATVTAGADLTPPLALASARRWRRLAGGPVFPLRRTEASFVSGASSVTVPALGVPAPALARLHGWRSGDGSAPLSTLARRITPAGPVRRAVPPTWLRRDARAPRRESRYRRHHHRRSSPRRRLGDPATPGTERRPRDTSACAAAARRQPRPMGARGTPGH